MSSGSLNMFLSAIKRDQALLLGKKILVVDPSSQVTTLLADVFTDAGACVTEAVDVEAAKIYVAWGGYDLIVVSPVFARRDAALRFIRDARPEMLNRTIVLTSNFSDATGPSVLKHLYPGCRFYPFVLVDLVQFACQALSLSHETRAA